MHIDYTHNQKSNMNKSDKKLFKNYEIFQGKIRLIEDGKAPIVIDRDEAIRIAESRGLDLVQIAYNKNDFPKAICKIYDYSKMLYEQKKKEKMAKKQARANEVEVKEVDFSIRIDSGDMDTKVRQIRKFIEDGNKVKVVVKLLRRESNLKDYALGTMNDIFSKVNDIAEYDTEVAQSGNFFTCVLRKSK